MSARSALLTYRCVNISSARKRASSIQAQRRRNGFCSTCAKLKSGITSRYFSGPATLPRMKRSRLPTAARRDRLRFRHPRRNALTPLHGCNSIENGVSERLLEVVAGSGKLPNLGNGRNHNPRPAGIVVPEAHKGSSQTSTSPEAAAAPRSRNRGTHIGHDFRRSNTPRDRTRKLSGTSPTRTGSVLVIYPPRN